MLTHEFILIIEERSMIQDEQPLPEHPEIVVFAAFSGPPKYPVRISVLGEMVRIANIHLDQEISISNDTKFSIQKSQVNFQNRQTIHWALSRLTADNFRETVIIRWIGVRSFVIEIC